ncbi:uncharacterized protein LOC123213374 [Mangifera indica]|uniref:uncharacterized protein LOC123213374 n=1 Tax=Mangifera indica TaxID=29780 RepID=UPI001CFC0590|nr:uncharacterized protein LOC123213374 [Mangifera indica]
MNAHKTEDDLFHHHHHVLAPHPLITQSQPSIHNPNHDDPPFSSLPEIVLFRTSSYDPPSHSSSENDDAVTNNSNKVPNQSSAYISPEPHISTQFYTFNAESHALMIRCILEQRLATPAEIRVATPRAVLKSWRSAWKDRNEDTAYLTAWKRIQDKVLSQEGH